MRIRNGGAWLAALVVLGTAAPAVAQEIRIVAVDGRLAPSGSVGKVRVWPGQVVSLSADEVWRDRDGSLGYAYRPVDDFVWSSTVQSGDVCDPAEDCRSVSNFEVTDYGVNFYVPSDAPARIRVHVRDRDGRGADSVVLVNEAELADGDAPVEANLVGMGYWTRVGPSRVFVPYASDPDWAPYRHGHWYWSSYGWTWYSYDPWGDVTDHCGHWRHSRWYGWVWAPDPVCTWRPAVVSWFFGADYIGWYPYDPGWSWGYRHGYADGFDDGYWLGWHQGRRTGWAYGTYRPGYTSVGYGNFYVPPQHGYASPPPRADRGGDGPAARADISQVRVPDRETHRNFESAIAAGSVGTAPGGAKDAVGARTFIAQRAGVQPVEVKLKPTSPGLGTGAPGNRSSRAWLAPEKPLHETPQRYLAARQDVVRTLTRDRAGGPKVGVPLGSLAAVRRPEGTSAGRGVALPPVSRDREAAGGRSWAPRNTGVSREGGRPEAVRRDDVRPQQVDRDAVRREQGLRDIDRETRRPDAVRPDPVRPDPVRPDPVRRETVRPEVDRDAVRPDPVRRETVRPYVRPKARPEARPQARPQVRPERPERVERVRPETPRPVPSPTRVEPRRTERPERDSTPSRVYRESPRPSDSGSSGSSSYRRPSPAPAPSAPSHAPSRGPAGRGGRGGGGPRR